MNAKTRKKPITKKKAEKWIEKNRPYLGLYDDRGNKGVYEKDLGPAHSFRVLGKTWRQVIKSLIGI